MVLPIFIARINANYGGQIQWTSCVGRRQQKHAGAALNQDWIFPAERRECKVEGVTVQYSGGFEVIFKGPYSFGSTSALAAAVGFTAPRRTNSINDALNPNKERRKGITTERACTAGASP